MKIQTPRVALAGAALLVLAVMPTVAAAQEVSDLKSNGNLDLKGYGSFFIQGNAHTIDSATAVAGGFPGFPIPGGLSMIDQMYVQYMLPQAQSGKKHYPIVFVHGCCLSSKSWQTTPDGRMGWYEYFVRQGFDTYLADQVSRARSGFDGRKFNNVRAGLLPPAQQPVISLSTDVAIWNAFRFAPPPCTVSPCYATATP